MTIDTGDEFTGAFADLGIVIFGFKAPEASESSTNLLI